MEPRKTTWTDKSTNKELAFSNDASGMANMDLPGITKTRFQIVVRESAKLQLEGESWFHVSEALFFSPHSITSLKERSIQGIVQGDKKG